VINAAGELVGVVTRRDLLDGDGDVARSLSALVKRPPVVVFDDSSLRDAADQMTRAGVGRVPVISRQDGRTLCGILTRSDLLAAHGKRLDEAAH
jgi:CBS domain-containing protein